MCLRNCANNTRCCQAAHRRTRTTKLAILINALPSHATTSVVPPLRRSERNLARGERFLRTPGTRAYVANAPRQGAGSSLQPLPGCVSLLLFYPGVRPAGADFGTAEVVPSRLWP